MSRNPELFFDDSESTQPKLAIGHYSMPNSIESRQSNQDHTEATERRKKKLSRVFGTQSFPFLSTNGVTPGTNHTYATVTRPGDSDSNPESRAQHHRSKTVPYVVANEIRPSSQIPPLPYTRELDFRDTILATPPPRNDIGSNQQPKRAGTPQTWSTKPSRYVNGPGLASHPGDYSKARPNYPNPFLSDVSSVRGEHSRVPSTSFSSSAVTNPDSIDSFNIASLHVASKSVTPTGPAVASTWTPEVHPRAAVPHRIASDQYLTIHEAPATFKKSDGRPLRPRPQTLQAISHQTMEMQRRAQVADQRTSQYLKPPNIDDSAYELPTILAAIRPSSKHDKMAQAKMARAAALTAAQEHWRPIFEHRSSDSKLRETTSPPSLTSVSPMQAEERQYLNDAFRRGSGPEVLVHSESRASTFAPLSQQQHPNLAPPESLPAVVHPLRAHPIEAHSSSSSDPTMHYAVEPQFTPYSTSSANEILTPELLPSPPPSVPASMMQPEVRRRRDSRRYSFDSVATAQVFTVTRPGRARKVHRKYASDSRA